MRNEGYIYRDRIGRAEQGWTALDYYARLYPHAPRGVWEQRFAAGLLRRNGAALDAGDVLLAGDALEYHRPGWDEPDPPGDIPVLHDDAFCMVFDKPPGLPVLPGGGFLEYTLLRAVRRLRGADLSPVHRLGRGTTGAILFSRTPAAAAFLAAAMRARRIGKSYLAVAAGTDMPDHFDVDAPIGPVEHPLLGRIHAATPGGRPSLSHVHVLRRDAAAGTALLRVDIPTGRPHQIRIHCAAAGWPLAGDPLYLPGGHARPDAVPGDEGYLLHSWQLTFPHPAGGETRIVCPVRWASGV